jgi:hypothetical protein
MINFVLGYCFACYLLACIAAYKSPHLQPLSLCLFVFAAPVFVPLSIAINLQEEE